MGLPYRVRQFLSTLFERPAPELLREARAALEPRLWALFQQLPRAEQAHALQVFQDLRAEGQHQPDLLAAALLHDIGKIRAPLSVLEKVAVVITKCLAPELARRWGQGTPAGWRRSYAVAAQHAAWGAEIVRSAGGSSTLAELIARHHEPPPEENSTSTGRLLAALQTADDLN